MLNRLKFLDQKLNNKTIRTILLIVVFPIIALRMLGILQWMELTAYDLLFYFSPNEPREERIVLVAWDEQDIQRTKEVTFSDYLLGLVLEKIKAQEPRLIGLDLYRDIPVFSNNLEKKENEQAYNKLGSIFRSTPNLIGIEKVNQPIIAPPPALKEQERVASSDLVPEIDKIVRRAYIDPQPLEKENDLSSYRSAPYLATVLGVKYLVEEGFDYQSVDKGSLMLSKGNNKIVVNILKTFDGGYINNRTNLDFLVNWRRGKDLFKTVSVKELIAGEIPPDTFRDKIVLIGNVAASTQDRHNIPLTRWNKNEPWTYGLYIQAHVASSIISAALDGRPLIKVIPLGSGYILLLLSVASTALIIFKYSDNFSPQNLYLISFLFSLGLTLLLSLSSLLAFQFGWWIPLIPAILGIWLTFITINNQVQIIKEQENTLKLQLIAKELNHKIGNRSYKMSKLIKNLENISEDLYRILSGEHEQIQKLIQKINQKEEEIKTILKREPFWNTEKQEKLAEILEELEEINQQINILEKYKKRTTEFITIVSSKTKIKKQATNVNELVNQVVTRIKAEELSKYEYEIWVEQIQDSSLKQEEIDRLSLEIILDNLIENALEAVEPDCNKDSSYRPTVKIETRKTRKWIEISVEDNGSGIPQSKQQEIFQPFVSFKMERGQGIGLALVKRLLSLEQGTIKVESKLGKGSKFTISLPIKRK